MFCQFDKKEKKKKKKAKYLPARKTRKANFLPLNQHLQLEVFFGEDWDL